MRANINVVVRASIGVVITVPIAFGLYITRGRPSEANLPQPQPPVQTPQYPSQGMPAYELKAYNRAVAEAYSYARQGRVDKGYATLFEGFLHVEEEYRAGAPWGNGLMGLYRQALDQFHTLHNPFVRRVARVGRADPVQAVSPVAIYSGAVRSRD